LRKLHFLTISNNENRDRLPLLDCLHSYRNRRCEDQMLNSKTLDELAARIGKAI